MSIDPAKSSDIKICDVQNICVGSTLSVYWLNKINDYIYFLLKTYLSVVNHKLNIQPLNFFNIDCESLIQASVYIFGDNRDGFMLCHEQIHRYR